MWLSMQQFATLKISLQVHEIGCPSHFKNLLHLRLRNTALSVSLWFFKCKVRAIHSQSTPPPDFCLNEKGKERFLPLLLFFPENLGRPDYLERLLKGACGVSIWLL